MQKVTFVNAKGERVEIGYGPPFFLSKIEGLGDVTANIHNQRAPYQDGSTYIDATLQIRPISIDVEIMERIEENRRLLSRVFNPKLGEGVLTYENNIGKWQIKVVPEHVPVYPDSRPRMYQLAMINLIAHDPYWKSAEIISNPMTAYRGLFKFPLTFPTQMGEVGSTQIFVNEGDVDTPVQIEFRGPALNPRVTNKTTGEFIQINRELEDGDRLIVDTTFGNKRVEIIRLDGTIENVLNWIDLNSTFWQLIPGPNEIEYTADAGQTNAVVSIKWRNQYLAV